MQEGFEGWVVGHGRDIDDGFGIIAGVIVVIRIIESISVRRSHVRLKQW